MLYVPVVRNDLYFFAQIGIEIGHRPIPEWPGLDGAKGVQAKQLHRTEPPVEENLFSGTNSEMLPSSAQDFFDVTLVREESALGLHWCAISLQGVRLWVHWCYIGSGGRSPWSTPYLTQTEDASFFLIVSHWLMKIYDKKAYHVQLS